MSGVVSKPLDVADNIRKLLSEYRSGFPFFKEVIQNANDANAEAEGNKKQVGIRWVPGLGDKVEHPLLQGPALVVINDGPFSKEDRDGIVRMGLSNRAADTERVGRFGLGIKSLFHICEAFFYLESGRSPVLRDIFTPWHDRTKEETTYYQEWWMPDETADWDTLDVAVRELFPEFDSGWFALWIPLRSRRHCKEGWTFRSDYLGEPTDGCPESLRSAFLHRAPSIAESMVFLDHIERVAFHDGEGVLTIKHDRQKQRIGGSDYFVSRFDEFDGEQDIVGTFQKKEQWPKITDPQTTQPAPDKAKWAGGVAVTSTAVKGGEVAYLRVFWSVFLPVGNEPIVNEPIEGLDSNIHIFAHGFFFPNRDRTLVLGSDKRFSEAGDKDEERLKILWNKELATSPNGVLTRLIPTLVECLESGSVAPDVIERIVRNLRLNNWYTEYREAICQEWSFARTWDGREWSWNKLGSECQPLVLPSFNLERSQLDSILTELNFTATDDRPTVAEAGTYLSQSHWSAKWGASDLAQFLKCIDAERLKRSSSGRRFIAMLLNRYSSAAAEIPELWRDLPIYELERLGGAKKLKSANQVADIARQEILFSRCDGGLRRSLPEACPGLEVWIVGQHETPPEIQVQDLSIVQCADMILDHQQLGPGTSREMLVNHLLPSFTAGSVSSAIRYLLHGCFEQRQAEHILFFKGTNDSWNQVIERIIVGNEQSWRLIEGEVTHGMSEHQQDYLHLRCCGAESFRDLSTLDYESPAEWEIGEFRDFLLTHLTETDDVAVLRGIRIHQVSDSRWTGIDETVWLEPEKEVSVPPGFQDEWALLKNEAQIVTRSDVPVAAARQQEVFGEQVLDENGIIRLACNRQNPTSYAGLIVSLLGGIGNPRKETREALQRVAWIPLKSGDAGRLRNLLWFEGAEDELNDLLGAHASARETYTKGGIAIDLADDLVQRGWKTIRGTLIPKSAERMDLLRKTFAENAAVWIGLPEFDTKELLDRWLNSVGETDESILPAARLINALCARAVEQGATGAENIVIDVANAFAKKWQGNDARRYDDVLHALRELHRTGDSEHREDIINTFRRYLLAASQAGRWQDCYVNDREFELLNAEGDWKPISQLVFPIDGVAPRATVEKSCVGALGLEEALHPARSLPGASLTQAASDAGVAALLRDYGESVAEHLPRRLWGAFVALLGDGSAIRALADELTGGTNRVEMIRDELFGEDSGGLNPRGRLAECRFACDETEGKTIQLSALTGDRISVPLDKSQASLFTPQIGRDDRRSWRNAFLVNPTGDGRNFQFSLCDRSTFRSTSPARLRERLAKTLECLLSEVFHLGNALDRIGNLLDALSGMGQPTLGRAQHEIVATTQMHLNQLGYRPVKGSELAEAVELLSDWNKKPEDNANKPTR